jgi:hypothetical protein
LLSSIYWKPDGDVFVKTYLKDGKLRVSFDSGNDYALKPVSETFFHIADVPWGDQANLHFEPAAENNPRRLLNSFGDGKPGVFDSVAPFLPSAAESGEYAGNYVSEEIEAIYRVAVRRCRGRRRLPVRGRASAILAGEDTVDGQRSNDHHAID